MRDHTSLLAWQEAKAVALGALQLGDRHWRPSLGAAYAQLCRSSLSVQLNISEGYAFGPSPTFRRHLAIAYGSAVETTDLLEDLRDSGLLAGVDLASLIARSRRTQALIRGLQKRMG
ncbi:MAG TPA: four helix bundle protein [Gemmatimonadales bacterium]|nr:four helix bundle protein [Gemmatimonadales bacterium]